MPQLVCDVSDAHYLAGCSSPPCDDCFAGKPLVANLRPGCEANDTSIGCIPPETTMGYKGQHWPTTYIDGTQEMHIFLIGDWGGLDGSLDTNQGRPELIAYNWGRQPGPSVFPRSRWNKRHTEQLCSHKEFVECFNTFGEAPCIPECGFVMGVDDKPQLLVAEAFKARAALKDPQHLDLFDEALGHSGGFKALFEIGGSCAQVYSECGGQLLLGRHRENLWLSDDSKLQEEQCPRA